MPNFTTLSVKRDQQQICRGCQDIEGLFEFRRSKPRYASAIGCQFHETFNELQTCAKRCYCCRVFLRAYLTRRITSQDVKKLKDLPARHQIWAKLEEDILEVQIRNSERLHSSARVRCLETNAVGFVNLEPQTVGAIKEAKWWFDECHHKHGHSCGNLKWSGQNPSRLVRIFPDLKKVQLVDAHRMQTVRYAALSYAWGVETTNKAKEKEEILSTKGWKYTDEPFPLSELPATIRDAMRVTQGLGIDFIWIDALCIRTSATTTWNYEAARMHEVYGNACVTLCACSSEKSIDGLFNPRGAWEYPSEPCRLDQFWLANFDMTLNEVRLQAPLFSRAWTLQEERLSPRILYLCGQRVYWSCSGFQRSELGRQVGKIPPRKEPYGDPSTLKRIRDPQEFLRSRHEGKVKLLHQQWLELVQDYTRRSLFKPKQDRFDAISGLAAQYLVPFCSNNIVRDQEYLAGLWRLTFAQDLAWSVQGTVSYRNSLRDIVPAPSWSWASLPLCTVINMPNDFTATGEFTLLEGSGLEQEGQSDDVLSVAKRGALVRLVEVRGLMRRFFKETSRCVAWSTIQSNHGRESEYSFSSYRAESVHSINDKNGKILAYEPHMQEVVGQLDYLSGYERGVYCFQIGESSMLLLVKAGMITKGNTALQEYCRVGASSNVPENFFAHGKAEVQRLVLI